MQAGGGCAAEGDGGNTVEVGARYRHGGADRDRAFGGADDGDRRCGEQVIDGRAQDDRPSLVEQKALEPSGCPSPRPYGSET